MRLKLRKTRRDDSRLLDALATKPTPEMQEAWRTLSPAAKALSRLQPIEMRAMLRDLEKVDPRHRDEGHELGLRLLRLLLKE